MSSEILHPVPLPGLLVVGTDTGVGKTIVACAIAAWFKKQGATVAVCKPIATGCVHRREGLVSEDAELLAHFSDTRHPLDLICPNWYAEPLAPAIAAERAKQPVDFEAIDRSIRLLSDGADVMIVEGIGGVMVPVADKLTFLDLAADLALPAIVVARPTLGTINHTLLTVEALRRAGVEVAGVVINRYVTDKASIAEESNPRAIEKWGKLPVLCVVPEERPIGPLPLELPAGIVAAVGAVDWTRFTARE